MSEGLFFILASIATVTGIVSAVTLIRYGWHHHRGTIVSAIPTGRSRVMLPWDPTDTIEVTATLPDGGRAVGWIWDMHNVLHKADSVEVALVRSKRLSGSPQLKLVAPPSLKVARVTGIVTVAAGSGAVLACWASVCS